MNEVHCALAPYDDFMRSSSKASFKKAEVPAWFGKKSFWRLTCFSVQRESATLACSAAVQWLSGPTTALPWQLLLVLCDSEHNHAGSPIINATVKVRDERQTQILIKIATKAHWSFRCKSLGPFKANSNIFLANSIILSGITFPSGIKQTIYSTCSSDSFLFYSQNII